MGTAINGTKVSNFYINGSKVNGFAKNGEIVFKREGDTVAPSLLNRNISKCSKS